MTDLLEDQVGLGQGMTKKLTVRSGDVHPLGIEQNKCPTYGVYRRQHNAVRSANLLVICDEVSQS